MTQASDWTGAVGDAWAAEWRRTDRSLADLSRHLDRAILAAAPPGRFRALDIGCGAGATTLALATARPDADILGVDLSTGLVDAARARSDTARFIVGDVAALAQREGPFDLLYSRHGVMFFPDPTAAFAALHRAAAPDATLVFSCFADWGDNGFASALAQTVGAQPPAPHAPGPFAFADPVRVAAILGAAGWRDAAPARVSFTYRAGEGQGDTAVADALGFFQRIGPAARPLREAAPADRAAMLARLTEVLIAHRTADAIDFPAAAWIWSAKARQPQTGERA